MTGSFGLAAADPAGGQDANAVYALGSSTGESARLQRQADELAPDSAALLDRVALRAGQSAIDLGCGPRGILDLLAARTSPGGRVVGLDANPARPSHHRTRSVRRARRCLAPCQTPQALTSLLSPPHQTPPATRF